MEAAHAAARAGGEEPAYVDHRDRTARWSDEFDNNYERNDDDDENRNADRYGRRMIHDARWVMWYKLSVTAITNHDYET